MFQEQAVVVTKKAEQVKVLHGMMSAQGMSDEDLKFHTPMFIMERALIWSLAKTFNALTCVAGLVEQAHDNDLSAVDAKMICLNSFMDGISLCNLQNEWSAAKLAQREVLIRIAEAGGADAVEVNSTLVNEFITGNALIACVATKINDAYAQRVIFKNIF